MSFVAFYLDLVPSPTLKGMQEGRKYGLYTGKKATNIKLSLGKPRH